MNAMPTQSIPTVPTSSHWHNADQLCDGNLADIILRLRGAGLSWAAISRRLWDEYRCRVENSTLSAWHRQLTAGRERVS